MLRRLLFFSFLAALLLAGAAARADVMIPPAKPRPAEQQKKNPAPTSSGCQRAPRTSDARLALLLPALLLGGLALQLRRRQQPA